MSSTALALSLLLAGAAAADAPPPAPEALLAEAKAAAGGEAWDRVKTLRTRSAVQTSGLTGTAENLDDLVNGRTRERAQLGPIRQAQGFDGKTVWSQDTSGQVREEAGGDARLGAIDDAYRRRFAWWYPARAAARIEARGVQRVDDRALHVLTSRPRAGGRSTCGSTRPRTSSTASWRRWRSRRAPRCSPTTAGSRGCCCRSASV